MKFKPPVACGFTQTQVSLWFVSFDAFMGCTKSWRKSWQNNQSEVSLRLLFFVRGVTLSHDSYLSKTMKFTVSFFSEVHVTYGTQVEEDFHSNGDWCVSEIAPRHLSVSLHDTWTATATNTHTPMHLKFPREIYRGIDRIWTQDVLWTNDSLCYLVLLPLNWNPFGSSKTLNSFKRTLHTVFLHRRVCNLSTK